MSTQVTARPSDDRHSTDLPAHAPPGRLPVSGMPVRATFVLALAATALGIALTLTGAPPRVVRIGARPDEAISSRTNAATANCQSGETLPAGVTAVRLGVEASFGPSVAARAYAGGRLIAAGTRAPGWTGSSVTVPLQPLARAVSPVKLCLSVPANGGLVKLWGQPGRRVSVEYLAPGHGSWWSRLLATARRIGIGHALAGTWVAGLVAVLVAAACALVVLIAWKELP